VNLKQIGRWGLLALVTSAVWSMGPLWKGMVQTEQAFAATQIQELGQEIAIQSYYDVASSAQISAGGYGGPGHSGGDGDALVRLVNTGNFEVSTNLIPGALCANFYVFDDDQELQECCSCLITADGVTTTSTITNLISNPAFHNAKMSLGAVKVVGSSKTCKNPTTAASLSPVETDTTNLAEGLKGWMNHVEKIATNLPRALILLRAPR